MFKVLVCISLQHDWRLTAAAAAVCALACLATFQLYAATPTAPRWRRWAYLAMSGIVTGSGIWTTHFVAMLAYETGLPTRYALGPTALSLLVAIAAAVGGLALAASGGARLRARRAAGGLVLGLGIAAMHYVGMGGYRTAGEISWNGAYVAASVLIGAALSVAALSRGRPDATRRRRVEAAGLLLLAIVGMHFTGMAAVTITPDSSVTVPPTWLAHHTLALLVAAATGLIIIVMLLGAAFDSANRAHNLRRLREALDAMPDCIAIFDTDGRLITWNNKFSLLCETLGSTARAGLSFADLTRRALEIKAFPDAVGREAEWWAARRANRATRRLSADERLHTGRWVRMTERATADGGTVWNIVDITDLKAIEQVVAEARERAEESARRAETAEEIAGLGHWRLDVATNEITWSPQLYRICGVDPSKPLKLDEVHAMMHVEDFSPTNDRVNRMREAGGGTDLLLSRIIRPDGAVRYIQTAVQSEYGPDGEIRAIIGTALDVTAQRLAEIAMAESEERFRRLAMTAPDMIVEGTLDGIMTYISPASATVTGFEPDELIGRHYSCLMDAQDAAKVQQMCAAIIASKGAVEPTAIEIRATHKSGHEIWLECKPTLVTDPETGRFVGVTDVLRDITGRKALEAELRKARAEAEAAAAVKGEFLANMSHELRTPLTSIIGFTNLTREQPDLPDLARGYVERVSEASRALLCTVNDILDFSKLEAGQVTIHPQPMQPSALTRAALDLFEPQAAAKGLKLVLDEAGDADLTVILDPDRIRQVLLNFISNAVKFSDQGDITLRAGYDERKAVWRAEVHDGGAGISKAQQKALFKRFSQIDGSLTRGHGGTGLGLAICKGLIEAMGGRIGVTSRLGKGSCFWFEVPALRAETIEAVSEPADAGQVALEGLRVLVVDDHATNRELARLFLCGMGAEVSEAEDGVRGVELARQQVFDVILLDLRMPGCDGFEALKRIRQSAGPNAGAPILAFTADATRELGDKLLQAGFTSVVSKPLDAAQLITAVANAALQPPWDERDVA